CLEPLFRSELDLGMVGVPCQGASLIPLHRRCPRCRRGWFPHRLPGQPSCPQWPGRRLPFSRCLSSRRSLLRGQELKRRPRSCLVECTSCQPYSHLGLEPLLKRELSRFTSGAMEGPQSNSSRL